MYRNNGTAFQYGQFLLRGMRAVEWTKILCLATDDAAEYTLLGPAHFLK